MLAVVLLLSALFVALRGHAATAYTWNNVAGGSWVTNTNWTPNGIPGAADSVTIGTITAGNTISLGANQSCTSVTISTNNSFTLGSVGQTLTVSGTFTDSDTGIVTVTCNIAGATTMTKNGAGTLILNGNDTYTGATTINAGTLRTGGTGIGPTSAVTLANVASAVLDLNGSNQTIGSLSGGGTTGGNVTLGAGTLTIGNASSTTYSGVISGTGSVVYQGAGTLTLSGGNTFTGGFTINNGTISCGADFVIAATCQVLINAAGTWSTNGTNQTIGSLAGSGNMTLSNSGPATITFGGDNTTTVFSGNITGGNPNKSLVKTGTGSMTISGTGNNYKGPVTVANGIFNIAVSTGLGLTNSGTTVNSGGTLEFSGNFSEADNITLNGTGFGGIGALLDNTGNVTLTGNITLATAAPATTTEIAANTGTTLTITGGMGGTGPMTTGGAGVVDLKGGNNYTGGTTVSSGITEVDGSVTGTTTVNATLTGVGTTQAVSVAAGGAIEPGDVGATGILTAAATTFANSASLFNVMLNGTGTAGGGGAGTNYDQLHTTGQVTLNNASLNIFLGAGFTSTNNFYTIINNTSGLPIAGTFNGLPEGAVVLDSTGKQGFSITYLGNGTHSVVLHQVTILVSSMYNEAGGGLGSLGGVQAGDTVTLTFSEPVTSTGALISDIGLAVTGDSFSTSTIANQGPSTTITIVLGGAPLLTPAGVYSPGPLGQNAGQPSGVYIISGTHLIDADGNQVYGFGAGAPSAAAIADAVDLGPGTSVVAVQWGGGVLGYGISAQTWALGNCDPSDVFTASNTGFAGGFVVRNSSTAYSHFTILCDTVSTPNPAVPGATPWTLATAPASDKFSMWVDPATPITGGFTMDLSAGAQTLAAGVYSGQTRTFDLQFTAPSALTSTSTAVQQTINVTIVISAP